MPSTTILFYQEKNGTVPVLAWLDEIIDSNPKLYARVHALIGGLEAHGRDFGPPRVKPLGSGIWELRARFNEKNYRVLFFFSGRDEITLSHAFLKDTQLVPQDEIDLAVKHKQDIERDHDTHIYKELE